MLKKKDFIEIRFTAKIQDGEIFDSNIEEDLKKSDLDTKAEPFIFALGEGMFLKGVEDQLIGKEVGKYDFDLTPENAFGNRDAKLIQLVPMKVFREQNIRPIPGYMFNFDGRVAKILSASGGRVRVDFNNPIAGKNVTYHIEVVRIVDDSNEKAKAFINFLFKRDFPFEIKDKKLIIEADEQFAKFLEMFKDKFKEVLELDLEVKGAAKEEKKDEIKTHK